jgi:hypothetical protein
MHQQGSLNITAANRTGYAQSIQGNPVEKYILWCVDGSSNDTILHQICVESTIIPAIRGKDFIQELLDSYKRLRGWRWWLSFTVCTEANLVKASSFVIQGFSMKLILETVFPTDF